MTGRVSRWYKRDGYGYIEGNDKKSYYVHFSYISDDFLDFTFKKNLCIGETVRFIPAHNRFGDIAANVTAAV